MYSNKMRIISKIATGVVQVSRNKKRRGYSTIALTIKQSAIKTLTRTSFATIRGEEKDRRSIEEKVEATSDTKVSTGPKTK